MEWAIYEFLPTVQPSLANPALLAMDCVSFYKSPELLQLLRENYVIVVIIPPGCTSLL